MVCSFTPVWRVWKVLCTFKPVFQQLITITPLPLKVCLLNHFCFAHSLTGGNTQKIASERFWFDILHCICHAGVSLKERPGPLCSHELCIMGNFDLPTTRERLWRICCFKKSKIRVNTNTSLSGAAIFCLPEPALLILREDALLLIQHWNKNVKQGSALIPVGKKMELPLSSRLS